MQEEDNRGRSLDLNRQVELELLAERMVVDGGLGGLSIDRLAQKAGYSRPTVYRHFSSKEDALSAVVIRAVALGESLFERLSSPVDGNRREQAMALFVAFEQIARFHPNAFEVTEMLAFEWMREATAEDTQWRWVDVITVCFRRLEESVGVAAAQGELTLRGDMSGADVTLHSITMAIGMYAAMVKNRVTYQLANVDDGWKSARMALYTYWDGLGWVPLSADFDYEASHDRILKQLYPEYWLRGQTEALEKEVSLPGSASQSTGAPA